MRVVYINKYFFPMQRHSGIMNFAYDLSNNLAQKFDLEVISWKYSKGLKSIEDLTDYRLRRVGKPFRLKSAYVLKRLQPDLIILGSGIKYPEILLFVTLFVKLINPSIPIIIYQHSITKSPKISLTWFFNRICAGFWFSNPFIKDKILKRLFEKAIYVPVGIDPARLKKPSSIKKKGIVRIGYFGHLNKAKGVDRLLEAFLKLDLENCELFMAGEGPLTEKLKELAGGRKDVYINGYFREVISYINSCDILVFPFRDAASILGLSLSCLEGISLGKPIIASNNITLTPIVRHKYNGFIFDRNDDLVHYLKLLVEDEKKREIMGRRSKEISEEYSIKKVVKRISNIIEEVLSARGN